MGKKLDALLRRNPKPPKIKTLANLTIARIAILKNQRQVRCSHARSDVVQLLNLGHQDRALLRVEHVIRERCMLDVFVMIENYCHLLIDGAQLFQNNRDCPEELNEAVSSLIFAASRCGELPELQEIRGIFTSRYGKEFVARAVELRNYCRVNLKMVKKLSTTQASLENRQNILKQIASDNGITLRLDEDDHTTAEEEQDINQLEKQLKPTEACNNDPALGVEVPDFLESNTEDEKFTESMKGRKKYKDVADAARDAFESAAYAAVAARAAVELCRSESRDEDHDDHHGSNHTQQCEYISGGTSKSKHGTYEDVASENLKSSDSGFGFDKIHPVDSFCPKSEDEDTPQNRRKRQLKDWERSYKKEELGRTFSSPSSDTDIDNQYNGEVTTKLGQTSPLSEEIVFDESDEDTENNTDSIPWLKHNNSGSNMKCNLPMNKYQRNTRYDAVADESFSDKGYKPHGQSLKWKPLNTQADLMKYSADGTSRFGTTRYLNAEKHLHSLHSNTDRSPTSTLGKQIHRDSYMREQNGKHLLYPPKKLSK
ncbi:hypothetical protein RHGRI_028715 [Rhododendron griersonianum]|uniref:Regulator of Vps4 activity in the MVB pathway protein n=1 Tax=Rhododendron griersonianum TaxID=479676 RepID=A0AAV6IGS6_9ERIC|nr:hypothetical protein RHGRI_028715 [Rhododendron griersonianum]